MQSRSPDQITSPSVRKYCTGSFPRDCGENRRQSCTELAVDGTLRTTAALRRPVLVTPPVPVRWCVGITACAVEMRLSFNFVNV